MRRLAILLVSVLVGCAMGIDDPEAQPSTYAISLPTTDVALLLDLVNYPGVDEALLDSAVGLDSRAAHNIIDYRNGDDGVSPSADDELFDDLAELDAIPYVGDVAFSKLSAYARQHPAPAAESVETVYFHGWESQTVVWGVNTLDQGVLNGLLDARAASGLIAHRPYASVTAMGPVAYVGASALEHLRGAAPTWWAAMHGSASSEQVLDGVSFDAATAQTAVAIANGATRDQLMAHGMSSNGASVIIGNRTYTTLLQVSNVSGVGTATMSALHSYAASGQWAAPAPTGFVLDAAALAEITRSQKEGMWEDEGFSDTVIGLAGGDNDLAVRILQALEAEIDRLAAPLLGTTYADHDTAADAVYEAAPVKALTRNGGWTYLATLGVTR